MMITEMAGNGELSPFLLPGGWVRGKMIGSGSFGVVYLAINKSNGSLFVVKSSESQEGNQSLENEATVLASLESPHIVQCLGKDVSFGENGQPKTNLFIEYMAAGSLGDVAQKLGGRLDEGVIRVYTREILKGLKYLHDKGIVHGDVKCQNVLLGTRGTVKLADFGCARPLSSNSNQKKFLCGTPLWMAPEVLRNEGLDFSADVWSLGCSVIEMATGKTPWGELGVSNPMAAILKIASSNERPSFPKEFSKTGLDFLKKCLVRCSERRSTVDELLNHPFITDQTNTNGKLTHTSPPQPQQHEYEHEHMYSPLSVLDVGVVSDDGYESEESEEMKMRSKIPFSVRHYDKKMKKKSWGQRQFTEDDQMMMPHSQEKWVTVRN